MEKAREALTVGEEGTRVLSKLEVLPHRAGEDASFYEGFALRGIRVDIIRPGYLSCSFKVPPRLTDKNENLSIGAIDILVDEDKKENMSVGAIDNLVDEDKNENMSAGAIANLVDEDKNENMSVGAIANLVDEVGGAAMHADGHHMKVSVDMSISFLSNAKLHDELEITSRVLGHRGSHYTSTYVLLRNKASGEVIAEGRHSLFGNLKSRI